MGLFSKYIFEYNTTYNNKKTYWNSQWVFFDIPFNNPYSYFVPG